MNYIKFISWFLGVSMFTFGVLKFVDPFKGWYTVQIASSNLGNVPYFMGIAGEIATGMALMVSLMLKQKLSDRSFSIILIMASLTIMGMMITGIYVHLQPAVPADVLPLKIKPPYIPAVFLLLAFINIVLTYQYKIRK